MVCIALIRYWKPLFSLRRPSAKSTCLPSKQYFLSIQNIVGALQLVAVSSAPLGITTVFLFVSLLLVHSSFSDLETVVNTDAFLTTRRPIVDKYMLKRTFAGELNFDGFMGIPWHVITYFFFVAMQANAVKSITGGKIHEGAQQQFYFSQVLLI